MASEAPLRVLITCRELAVRGGTQLYTRDLAQALRRLGQTPVVWSPWLGEVADEIRRAGIPVVESLDRLGEAPSVIHGQHHLEAMTAMLRFPEVPAIYVCHGWLPWQEAPPRFPTIGRYVAVDSLRKDRLVFEHGIAARDVEILPNFVDMERFRPRPPLPAAPARALVFSNQAEEGTSFLSAVRRACEEARLPVDVAGGLSGRVLDRPEEVLPAYDLVFARGRAALEAMAVGAAVVLCDREGSGPLVDSDRFDGLRDLNFGLGALTGPLAAERIGREIARYDRYDAARVSARVRRECGLGPVVERLLQIYREAIGRVAGRAPSDLRFEALASASDYLAWLGPLVERQIQEAAGSHAGDAEALAELRRSPFSRLRARLLEFRPLVAAYRSATSWRRKA